MHSFLGKGRYLPGSQLHLKLNPDKALIMPVQMANILERLSLPVLDGLALAFFRAG